MHLSRIDHLNLTTRNRIGIALCSLILFSAAARTASTEPLPILIDGRTDDWADVTPAYVDPAGDDGPSGIDLGRLWVADDPLFLFLQVEVGPELLLNDGHNLTLYLDTDANGSTGLSIGGIGAELEWRFGSRDGTFHHSGDWPIEQADIRFRASPTVTASDFELAIGRDTTPNGSDPLFTGTHVRILFRDEQGSGDHLPNDGEILDYWLDDGQMPPESPVPWGKELATDLRISTWNVLTDSPWDAGETARFGRIVGASSPEILNFQEIYDHTPQQTAALVESWLPSGGGEAWYAAGHNDCQTISRYPVENSWGLDGNLAVLLDTTPGIGSKLLIINAHLPCCSNDSGRQAEIDRILSFLRDAKSPGGQLDLPDGTPFLIVGDLNLVGLSQQLTSLVTGDIVDEQQFGSDFDPDWDGTSLTDLVSRQTEMRMAYTWRKDWSSYWPGRLDFMIFSDSVLQVANHFVVYTPLMSPDSLAAHGLHSDDSYGSDHLVRCSDFRPMTPSGHEDLPGDLPLNLELRLEPNPGRGGTRIVLDLAQAMSIRLQVYDGTGRLVANPLGTGWIDMPAGPSIYDWNGRDFDRRVLSAGTYVVRLTGLDRQGRITTTEKWTLLR